MNVGIVQRFSKLETTIKRIVAWVQNDYKTMDPEFMESVCGFLNSFGIKIFLSRTKVVPFSATLGTGL